MTRRSKKGLLIMLVVTMVLLALNIAKDYGWISFADRSSDFIITYMPDDQVMVKINTVRSPDEYISALRKAMDEVQRCQGRQVDFFRSNEITVILKPKPSASAKEGGA